MHLAVAPACDLGCRYCERAVGPRAAAGGGPGRATRVLSPTEAAELAAHIARRGWLRVVGIAGPGEPLANPETLHTLRLVGAAHPELVLCLSTNGLQLVRALPQLLDAGLRAITLTINTTSPATAGRLYSHAVLDGRRLSGQDAAEAMLDRQWRGLEAAVAAGLLVKVNSVHVPGVNDGDLVSVARRAAEIGAQRQNIMPLIPRGRMRHRRRPSRVEVEAVRRECEAWIEQIRGCTQCRADAIMPPIGEEGGNQCTEHRCAGVETAACPAAVG
jgi:nitrogen fixation protein NifB